MRLPWRRRDPKLALLAQAPVFRGLALSDLRHVATCLDEVEVPRSGYVLLREGRTNRTFWLLLGGSVEVTFGGRPMRSHGPGETLGVPSLLDRRPAGVTVITREPVHALVASIQQFEAMRLIPAVDLRLTAAVTQRLRDDYLRVAALQPISA